jgi:hypothetical protein
MILGMGPEVSAYWEAAFADPGRTKGPIHLVVKIITECGTHGSPTLWTVPRHGVLDILRDEDAVAVFRDMAVQSVWKDLARDRQGYKGLEQGIDYTLTLALARTLKGEQLNRMRAILQDGVWTPTRAARVNTGTDQCIFLWPGES